METENLKKDELMLRNKNFCDGCEHLKDCGVLGGLMRCEIYRNVRTPEHAEFLANKGSGYFPRPERCREDYP